MKTRPRCPNCGQEAFGAVCRWCRQPLPSAAAPEPTEKKEPEKKDAPLPPFQAIDRLARLPREAPPPPEKSEDKSDPGIVLLTDARQRTAPSVRDIAARAQYEADIRSRKLMQASQQKAAQIIRNAEHQVAALLKKVRAEAEDQAAAYVSEARRKSLEIMEAAEQAAREMVAGETVVKEAAITTARMLSDAREKADAIIREAEKKARELLKKPAPAPRKKPLKK
ncbi:MAG: hypothetical protein WC370_03535 [Dehalococcoidales bacterium]|jgi:vacuolar-type H+-ATPase subunit H